METISIRKSATRPEEAVELPPANRQARPNWWLHSPGCQEGGGGMGAPTVGIIPELPAGTNAVLLRGESHPSWELRACPALAAHGMKPRWWAMSEQLVPGGTNSPGHVPPASQGQQGGEALPQHPLVLHTPPQQKQPTLVFLAAWSLDVHLCSPIPEVPRSLSG